MSLIKRCAFFLTGNLVCEFFAVYRIRYVFQKGLNKSIFARSGPRIRVSSLHCILVSATGPYEE